MDDENINFEVFDGDLETASQKFLDDLLLSVPRTTFFLFRTPVKKMFSWDHEIAEFEYLSRHYDDQAYRVLRQNIALYVFVYIGKENRINHLFLLDISRQVFELPASFYDLHYLKTISYRHLTEGYGDDIGGIGFSFDARIQNIKALEHIWLSAYSSNELPIEIANLPKLKYTWFGYEAVATLKNPPREILEQGVDAIFNYFISIRESEETDYLHEAKLVVVGKGFVGKTSLVRKLTIEGYSLEAIIKSTEGIDIDIWEIPLPETKKGVFRYNIWDFAGQDKYDATHQFFITKRTLYLFVTDARQESNFMDFDYWLNIVYMLSNGSPVIVVQNKIDERMKQLQSQYYMSQFSNIFDFVDVSCVDGYQDSLDNLISKIIQVTRKMPQLGAKLPKVWVDIRKELKELPHDWITYDSYFEICKLKGLDEEQADHLSQYFHDLGVIIHHQHDFYLGEKVILNPDWAVDGVYSVLDSSIVVNNNGEFSKSDLQKIWGEERYSGMHSELLALMKKYELCFQINDDRFIAPELLPANPKNYKQVDKDSHISFLYQFTFMPAGLMTRFIVKANEYIEEENFWRGGVVIHFEGARAVLIEHGPKRYISVQVEGEQNRRELLGIIRRNFLDIFSKFEPKIEYKEVVACNCEQCLKSEKKHYFVWKTLLKYYHSGFTMRCDSSFIEVNVRSLVDGVSLDAGIELIETDFSSFANVKSNPQSFEEPNNKKPWYESVSWKSVVKVAALFAVIVTILVKITEILNWLGLDPDPDNAEAQSEQVEERVKKLGGEPVDSIFEGENITSRTERAELDTVELGEESTDSLLNEDSASQSEQSDEVLLDLETRSVDSLSN